MPRIRGLMLTQITMVKKRKRGTRRRRSEPKTKSKSLREAIHYVILAAALFVGYWIGEIITFTPWAMSSGWFGILAFFGWMLLILVAVDMVLHKVLKI